MLQVVQFPQAVEEGERELNFQVAPHVIIAIPAYNEERFIGSMVLQCLNYTDHVVVIDDGSSDATAAIAEQAGATVLSHVVNKGKSEGVNLPRFIGVGWFLGSAFPGLPGNMVLFGHLDGPNSTFGRLKELKVGDEFSVVTDEREHRYKVQSSFETTYDDVGVLAPTDTATATLITCSGRWDNLRQDYTHRLIVKAVYVGWLAIK